MQPINDQRVIMDGNADSVYHLSILERVLIVPTVEVKMRQNAVGFTEQRFIASVNGNLKHLLRHFQAIVITGKQNRHRSRSQIDLMRRGITLETVNIQQRIDQKVD